MNVEHNLDLNKNDVAIYKIPRSHQYIYRICVYLYENRTSDDFLSILLYEGGSQYPASSETISVNWITLSYWMRLCFNLIAFRLECFDFVGHLFSNKNSTNVSL